MAVSGAERMAAIPQKSILMTPDPYHVPGYGGYCAQFKYQIGQTFGRTTSRLLRDGTATSSGRLVLAEHRIPPEPHTCDRKDPDSASKLQLIQSRKQSWGDQKLVGRMVPGYTGFIPKSQHHFGKRYAQHCVNAIADFEGNQKKYRAESGAACREQLLSKPLSPIAAQARPFISKASPQHTMSPYYMKNCNPAQRFMSGYTGFVPRSRGLIGSGYPAITHAAINEFTNDIMKLQTLSSQPVNLQRPETVKVMTKRIYPADSGLVPHYTGHIPGEKFRYGNTFGHSTAGALDKKRLSTAV